MRLSTLTLQQNPVTAMLRQQATLSRTQNEIATGRRVAQPSDDPSAAARIEGLERTLSASGQFATNANLVTNRLSLEEQTLADAGNVLQRVRELTIQANSGALDPASRQMIGAELRQRRDEMVDLANRKDASGGYLFAGTSTATQPFARSALGVAYSGDSLTRSVQVGPSQRVLDGHSGAEVFMNIVAGNGTFTTAAAPGNQGSGSIDTGAVVDPASWVAGSYSLQFPTAGTYSVRDAGGAEVVAGAFTPGQAIEFLGARVTVKGAPAAGDSFAINRAGNEDIFATLDRLITTVESPGTGVAPAAQRSTAFAGLLQQLDQGLDHLLTVRAEVGARLSALDSATSARESFELEVNASLAQVRDLDYAEAIGRMNTQMVALQAAQQSYTRVAQLTLFDYL
jgi:flagellar hook-associated protein 3 FlgL